MNLFVDVLRTPEASTRLTRSQFAQKIGGRKHDYPRPSGVLIPRLLARVCGAQLPAASDGRPLGRAIVLRVSRTLRALPEDLLSLELPHPNVVLRSLPIEDRTRGVIERLLPILAKEPRWTVGRYLRIPKFGARCLVDLLAACEESGRPPKVPAALLAFTPVQRARLDDVRRLLAHMLPIAEEDVARLLIDEGLASKPVTLEHLARVFQTRGHAVPFRVVACGDTSVAVSAEHQGFSATVAGAAAGLVSHFGLSAVQAVVNQVGVLRASPTSRPMVNRLLVALPRLRWLDERMEWFSMVGDPSRLQRAIATVFAVADRVSLRELRAALAKSQPRGPRVPDAVMERYLSEVADCEIDSTGIRSRTPQSRRPLACDEAAVETVLVNLLSEAGAPLAFDELSGLASAAAIPEATVRRLIRTSPLFVPLRGHRVRLIGRRRRY